MKALVTSVIGEVLKKCKLYLINVCLMLNDPVVQNAICDLPAVVMAILMNGIAAAR